MWHDKIGIEAQVLWFLSYGLWEYRLGLWSSLFLTMRCIHKQDCATGELYICYITDISNLGMPLCIWAPEIVCIFHIVCEVVVVLDNRDDNCFKMLFIWVFEREDAQYNWN